MMQLPVNNSAPPIITIIRPTVKAEEPTSFVKPIPNLSVISQVTTV